MSTYKVIPNCTVEDAAGLAQNNMSAFWGEIWWRMLWTDRGLDRVIEAAAARQPANLLREREIRRHQKVVDTSTGEIVGYSRWIVPESHKGEWLEAQVPDVSKEEHTGFLETHAKTDWTHRTDMDGTDDHIHEGFRRHAPKGPAMKLDYLAVNPGHQRRGIGSMLIKSGVEAGDRMGIDIYLVAMGQKAADMYLKQGFDLREEHSIDLRPWGEEATYDTFILVRHAAQS